MIRVVFCALGVLFVSTRLWAEDAVPVSEPSPVAQEVLPKPRIPKGKYKSEKEAEGTQAPNRFEADTVLKSQYQLNGQHLEVDPD